MNIKSWSFPVLASGLLVATQVLGASLTYNTTGSWVAPPTVTSVTVEAWGGGGAGGGQDRNSDGGGGGGGGAYAKKNAVTVVPGNSYTVVVGSGGSRVAGENGNPGGDSYFINTTTVLAKGGSGGEQSTGTPPAGGAGGSAASSVGDIKYSGGNGGRGRDNSTGRGGPGGSSAGTGANGTNGPDPYSTTAASAAPAGGGIGGDGGSEGNHGSAPASGNGGGGGGSGEGSNRRGGDGADGIIILTWTATAPTVSTSAATSLTTSGATLNGTVSSNGDSTTVTFEYGLTASYGSTATATQSPLAYGASNSAVSAAITGLTCGTTYHYRAKGVNSAGTTNGSDTTFTTSACPAPTVTSINRASANPTLANTNVSWTVEFSVPVTGVGTDDFALFQSSGTTGASISDATGSGTTWTVTANTGTGAVGTLRLDLMDNDSITGASGIALGGAGAGNGNFTGQSYTLLPATCTPGLLFCDTFERSVAAGGSNTAGAVGTAPGYGAWTVAPLGSGCNGVNGNRGCAGIDSDIPPFSTPSRPRANATRAMFTRWTNVTVTSPVINLAGKRAQLSFWLRRGSDCFSEWPSNNQTGCNGTINPFTPTTGEEFQVQYKNNAGTWIVLAQYPMDDAPGEIIAPVIELPDDAYHATFQFRFAQPGGSGCDLDGGSCNNPAYGGASNVVGYDYWHVDNVSVREIPAVTYTGPFCDTFEGDLSRWSMAGTGGVRIGSTYYESGGHGMDLRWNNVSATSRATDLSTNSGNNLITFWVRRGSGTAATPNTSATDFPETGKSLRVDYLNSSNAWTTLATFAGGGTGGQIYSPTTTPATNSLTLPANAKWSGFKLRFTLLTGSGRFDQDYWHVDNACVGSSVGSTDLSLAMTSAGSFTPGELVTYTMTVTNNGPIIEPGPITIIDTLPTGLTFVSGSAGWSCQDVGQVVSCTQVTSLAVGATLSLTLTAQINDGAPNTITNTAVVAGQSDDPATANNTATKTDGFFVPSYEFTTKACANGDVVGSAACPRFNWSSQIAGKPSADVYLTAVNTSGVATQLSSSSATTVGFQFGLSCNDSATDHGVQASFTAAGTALPLCTTGGGTPSSWTASNNQIFATGSPSTGPFIFSYADAGEVNLYVRKATATTQMGSSDKFVVRPVGLCLYSTDLTNCAAANQTCSQVRYAGEAFNLTLKAVVWQSDSDADLCTGNATTPNFKLDGIALSHVLDSPSGGELGEIGVTTIDITENGWASISQTVSEVGVFTFTATPPVYIPGATAPAGGVSITPANSGHFGRFYPHHFDTTVTPGTGTFTYSGQPFSVKVGAENASGNVTKNFWGDYAEDVTLSDANYCTNHSTASTGCATSFTALGNLTNTSVPAASFTQAAAGEPTATTVTYTFTDSLTAPIETTPLKLRAISSSVSSSTGSEGTTPILSGRLRVENAFGSEYVALRIPAVIEYYTDGLYWTTNAQDSVTTFNDLNGPTGTLTVGLGTTSPLCGVSPSATPCSGGVACDGGSTPIKEGNLGVCLSRPDTAGEAAIAFNPPPWLNAAGSSARTSGRASFGRYHLSPRIINRRELR